MKKLGINVKKRIVGFALATIVLASSVIPTCAATVQFTFKRVGNTYGITTSASQYPGYVTVWAKVTNTNTGAHSYKSSRNLKAASVTATKTISNSAYVRRQGGSIAK